MFVSFTHPLTLLPTPIRLLNLGVHSLLPPLSLSLFFFFMIRLSCLYDDVFFNLEASRPLSVFLFFSFVIGLWFPYLPLSFFFSFVNPGFPPFFFCHTSSLSPPSTTTHTVLLCS